MPHLLRHGDLACARLQPGPWEAPKAPPLRDPVQAQALHILLRRGGLRAARRQRGGVAGAQRKRGAARQLRAAPVGGAQRERLRAAVDRKALAWCERERLWRVYEADATAAAAAAAAASQRGFSGAGARTGCAAGSAMSLECMPATACAAAAGSDR